MGGRVDGSCDRNHWKMPPKSMLKNTGFPGASLKLAEALMFSFFFENNPMCHLKCFNLTNKRLNTKDLEVIIQPNLPKSYQVSLKNLGNAGSIDIQKRQDMPHLDVSKCPISWMSYQKYPRPTKKSRKSEGMTWYWYHHVRPLELDISISDWVVVSNIFYFHPYLGKIPILTNIFQQGLKPPTSWFLKIFTTPWQPTRVRTRALRLRAARWPWHRPPGCWAWQMWPPDRTAWGNPRSPLRCFKDSLHWNRCFQK